MHILIPVLHRPTKPTGVCRHAVNLAECLAETHQVEQVTLLIGEWQQDYFVSVFKLTSQKIKLVSVAIKNSTVARNRWYLFGLPQLANSFKPDIIHLSFPFPFIRSWFDAPVVSTIHDLYAYECPENFGYPQVWFNQLFLRQCLRDSDGLICVSKCTLRALEGYFPKIQNTKRTTVIYNVVDFTDVVSKFPSQLKDKSSYSFLITVAQHRKNKNLNLLIEAYGNLLHSGQLRPDAQLFLVGSSGPETERLVHLVQALKLKDRVSFLSGLEDGELRWLYEQATLFIIPSSTEGFCLPLVEALILSCPAVCSDIPIFREVGSSQCRYFNLDEYANRNLEKAISAELSHVLDPKKSIGSQFSRQEISRQLLDFYRLF